MKDDVLGGSLWITGQFSLFLPNSEDLEQQFLALLLQFIQWILIQQEFKNNTYNILSVIIE